MITEALPLEPMVQSSSSDNDKKILNVSLPSIILSSFIGIVNVKLVTPAGIVTVYGPES